VPQDTDEGFTQNLLTGHRRQRFGRDVLKIDDCICETVRRDDVTRVAARVGDVDGEAISRSGCRRSPRVVSRPFDRLLDPSQRNQAQKVCA
jgi:hypothetical protein